MTVVALGRGHPSIFKAPILREVDTRIFSLRYFTRCMSCGFCNDQCCSYGVDIDFENAQALRGLGATFRDFIGVPEQDWFTAEVVEDAEFPSGRYIRTQTRGSHCVFHRKDGRGCLIHAYCLESGLDYHLYKPMVSILFPLTFNHGRLEPSSEVLDGSLVCAGDGPSLYEGVRGELEYYFGAGLIEELEAVKVGTL
jgi:hypothetical protein